MLITISEALRSSKTSVTRYQWTRRDIQKTWIDISTAVRSSNLANCLKSRKILHNANIHKIQTSTRFISKVMPLPWSCPVHTNCHFQFVAQYLLRIIMCKPKIRPMLPPQIFGYSTLCNFNILRVLQS
jgi:hypothetical protein